MTFKIFLKIFKAIFTDNLFHPSALTAPTAPWSTCLNDVKLEKPLIIALPIIAGQKFGILATGCRR